MKVPASSQPPAEPSSGRGASSLRREDELARADRAREADPALASSLYTSMADWLDPEDAADADRIEWLFRRFPGHEEPLERLALRAARTRAGTPVHVLGNALAGRYLSHSGRCREAEPLLKCALRQEAGEKSALERRLLMELAHVTGVLGREFEALTLARTALRCSLEAGDAPCEAYARFALAGVFVDLAEWARYDAMNEAVDDMLPSLPEWLRRRTEDQFLALRADAELTRGDAASAMAVLERTSARDDPSRRAWYLGFKAHILLELGRRDECLKTLDELSEAEASLARAAMRVEFVRALCVIRSGDPERAVAAAEAFLARLAEAGRETLGTGRQIEIAYRLGSALKSVPGALRAAKWAYDVAGEGMLARIGELDDFCRELPDYTTLEPEDREILSRYRNRLVATQRDVLESVGRLFEDALHAGDDRVRHWATPGGGVCVCAWCGRIQSSEGRWLPIGHFLPPRGRLHLTHGICPACKRSAGAVAEGR